MKRVAVVLYEGFCMFEFSVALETLAMSGACEIDVFGEEKRAYRSEEGLLAVAEHTVEQLHVPDYDGIILTGFQNEQIPIIDNPLFLDKLRAFHAAGKLIAAISAAPVFLARAGVLTGLSFMCGCPREGLLEEGFTEEDLALMLDWDACVAQYDTKCIRHGHIVTAVAYGFREWAMEIGRILDIPIYPRSFGLDA